MISDVLSFDGIVASETFDASIATKITGASLIVASIVMSATTRRVKKTTASNEKSKPEKPILGQRNPKIGWRNMFIYWTVCALVAHFYGGYFGSKRFWQLNGAFRSLKGFGVLMASIVATSMTKDVLCSRNITYGRKRNHRCTMMYSLLNGIFETLAFFVTYDWGKDLGANVLGWSPVMTGFGVFFVYCAAIHVAFWVAVALPPHGNPQAPNFAVHALPALTLMSVAWAALYEVAHQSLVAPIALHIWMNYEVSLTMNLSGPRDAPILYGDEQKP